MYLDEEGVTMKTRKANGFTLFELLAVLAIITIVLTLSVPKVMATINTSKETVCIENRKTIISTYKRYQTEKLLLSDLNLISLEDVVNNHIVPDSYPLDMYHDFCPSGGTIVYYLGRLICTHHDSDVFAGIEEPNIINENIFVYSSAITPTSGNVSGDGAAVFISGSYATNSGNHLATTNIFIDGDLSSGGSDKLGSPTQPGIIVVNGDAEFTGGDKHVYGNLYVHGNLTLAGTIVHGNVYVSGNAFLSYSSSVDSIFVNENLSVINSSKINSDSYVHGDLSFNWDILQFNNNAKLYYKGTLTYPSITYYNDNLANNVYHDENIQTVSLVELPQVSEPKLRSQQWYSDNGYINDSSASIVHNIRVYTESYQQPANMNSAENIIIVAYDGNIILDGMWGEGKVSGILFAPKGSVIFNGDTFEGLVIARDGFISSTSLGINFVDPGTFLLAGEELPFIP